MELAERVTDWAESIKSPYSHLNTPQLKFIEVDKRLENISVYLETNNFAALAARLEKKYNKLIEITEHLDRLCNDPNNKDIKPGELETAPQEVQIAAGNFVSLLENIKNSINPTKKDEYLKHGQNKLNKKVQSLLEEEPKMTSPQIAERIYQDKTLDVNIRQTKAWENRKMKKSKESSAQKNK